jgi:hypothetical protein
MMMIARTGAADVDDRRSVRRCRNGAVRGSRMLLWKPRR